MAVAVVKSVDNDFANCNHLEGLQKGAATGGIL